MGFAIILVVICFIAAVIGLNRTKSKNRSSANEKFEKYIIDNGYTITKQIDIPNYEGSSKFFIDDTNKYVHFLSLKNNEDIINDKAVHYKDVIGCELIKDERTVYVEKIVAIMDSVKKKDYVKKLGIRILFNDLTFPHLDILFINSMTGQTLTGLGHIVDNMNDWFSSLKIVVERGKTIEK